MLHIGILVDDLNVPVWMNNCIQALKKHADISIDFIVLNESPKKRIIPYRKVGYRILRKTDQLLHSKNEHLFKKEQLELDVPIIRLMPKQQGFSDSFSNDDLKLIASYKPDILIRFGFRILKGDILDLPKYGILSFHHGSTTKRRGGPPGFWEVINREPISTVSIQILTSELDGGFIVDTATIKTDITAFCKNQHKLYAAGVRLFEQVFNKASLEGFENYFENKKNESAIVYAYPIYVAPSNLKSIILLFKFIFRIVQRKFLNIIFKEQWQIYYKKRSDNLREKRLYSFKKLLPTADRFWADPFVIKKGNNFYLFFEEAFKTKKNAHISCIVFDDQGVPQNKEPIIVLEESFHLSYPNVFLYQGSYWMIPESAESQQVILYKAVDFPFRWEKHTILLDNIYLYDPTIHFHTDGFWYLMGTVKKLKEESADMNFHIYYTDNIFSGAWTSHPKNPIYKDVRYARPAGKLFNWNGSLIRPSQVCAPIYGYAVNFNRIDLLSIIEYKETLLDQQSPHWDSNIKGTHIHNYDEGFTCTDILVKRFRWSRT